MLTEHRHLLGRLDGLHRQASHCPHILTVHAQNGRAGMRIL